GAADLDLADLLGHEAGGGQACLLGHALVVLDGRRADEPWALWRGHAASPPGVGRCPWSVWWTRRPSGVGAYSAPQVHTWTPRRVRSRACSARAARYVWACSSGV